MDAALDSGVRRSPRRDFRLAPAGRSRRLAAVLTIVLLTLLWMLGGTRPADAAPAPAPTETAVTEGTATETAAATGTVAVALAPDNNGVLAPGADLAVSVSISNTTADALLSGSIHLWLDRAELGSRDALDNWLTPSTGATQSRDSVAADVATPALAPGSTGTFRVSLPAAQLGLGSFGAYGIEAGYTAGTTVVDARNTIVWSADAPARETAVAAIMPLTVPAGSQGLLTAAQLESYTAAGGVLTRKLESVVDRPVTLAIDPMVIVSIRVLGTAAPQSSLDWLARLAAAANPTFALSYADSDIAVERQAGAASLLTPSSFDYALQAANFQTLPTPDPFTLPGQVAATTTEDGVAAGSTAATSPADPAAASPTPSPTSTTVPTAGTLPTFAALTAWNYTRTDLAWPAAGTVTTDDLNFFAAGGLSTSILSSDNVALPASEDGLTPSAPATIGDKNAVIVDAGLSDALQKATAATTDTGLAAALAEVSGILAIVSAQGGSTAPALVVDLGREVPATAFGVARALDLVESLPWASDRGLADVLSVPALGVSVKNSDEPAARVQTVMAMLDYERQVGEFATVLAQPDLLTGRQRSTLLAVLAQSWSADPTGRTAAEADYATLTRTTLDSVKIIDGSNINLFATSSEVPVLISNDLNQAVTVELQVTPSNGRLVVEPGRIEVVVEAKSQKTARVPVKAAVASGQVDLRLELFSPSGIPINQAAPRQINVSADWEGIGTIVIAILAAALLAFGIVRQVLKRRRAKAAQAAGEPAPAEPGPDDRSAAEPAPTDTSEEHRG
ncbi:hypothetical protein B7R54_18605 [Subtercola boreus]|uniref:Uncharacterized protein n=1 Tax=Subtercola boreus TaxID=120213 RepID=A0A3E0VNE0_9MICO|nr:DUF6049 family protein [Subtercola boreus]RFA11000.1 hypothetical protein B7R54_18605 [Subtercola boreus]TQL55401.1 hypothetical protein FB464_2967 [Subtercola boreus]